AVEARPGIFVERESFRAVVAGRVRAVERAFALAAVEADERAVRARSPEDAIPIDIDAAHPDSLLRDGVEFAQLGLGIEAQEPRRSGESVERVPDRAVGRMRHHRVRTGAGNAHVLAGLGRLAGFGVFVDFAVAGEVE